jgi:C-terminal processing protease CtpA/Prc
VNIFFKEDGQGKYFAPKYIRSWRPDFKKDWFAGNIYILMSGRTHSVAGFFVALMSHHTNAVMVGEEAGGGFYVATGGNHKLIVLENTQLRVLIPTMRFFTNVSGQPEGRGTLPDHEVTQTYEDFMTDTDTEIEFVLELIKKGKER